MADNRKEYVVQIGGQDHVFLLTAEDAEKYDGAKQVTGAADKMATEAAKAQATANKALSATLNK
jgi:hypothetical protein